MSEHVREVSRKYAHSERLLDEARATIAELQKRIGELGAELGQTQSMARAFLDRAHDAEQVLTAERQRRKACEAALRPFAGGIGYPYEKARAHFARYPSESDNIREKD